MLITFNFLRLAHHHSISPNPAMQHHLPNHPASPSAPHHHPPHHLQRMEKPYSPQGSPESQPGSVYHSPPPGYTPTEEFAAQVSPAQPMSMNGVPQASPRFETEASKKTYINLATPPMEQKGSHEQDKAPYNMYASATTPATQTHEKYNGFAAASANQMWRAQEAVRESQQRHSTVIACQGTQRSAHPHASSSGRIGPRGEMAAFERLTDLLYDDLNRDEFDVYLKKETWNL